ncbi:hypothetical protein F2P56_010995 [Juglans regia]|uniref:Reverse transcriptase Ty1/copia-type domain-containing protein n=1 Tax=Juglans regia TaxID=51240 RepID=A0A833XSC3_JUGRE|nr:hypothetical protein F2P56_010995 [Juglans regia]
MGDFNETFHQHENVGATQIPYKQMEDFRETIGDLTIKVLSLLGEPLEKPVDEILAETFFQAFMANSSTNQLPLNTMVHMVTVKLTPTNYLLWRRQFIPLLESQDLMGYLDGFSPAPSAQILQLSAIGKPVDDTDKVYWFLRGLGSDYKIFSTSMLSQLPLPSFANLVSKALSHELFSRSLHGDSSSQSTLVAQRGSSSSSASSGCPKPGFSSSAFENFSKTPGITCQWCGKERHTAKKCHKLGKLLKKAKADSLIEAFAATSVEELTDSEWYTDTGATLHMTNGVATLDNSVPYIGNQRVYIGNGTSMPISRIGSISSIVASHPLPLSDVRLVPSLTKNLLSISKLTRENNCSVTFSSFGFTIHDLATRTVMGVGQCEKGLYVLDCGHASVTSAHRPAPTLCVPCVDSRIPSPHPEYSSQPSSPTIALEVIPPVPSSSSQLPTATHPMVTRAKNGIVKPRTLHSLYALSTPPWFQVHLVVNEPRGFKSAVKHLEWLFAMDDEIATLKHNNTWRLVPRPNVVGCRWIFKTKLRRKFIWNNLHDTLISNSLLMFVAYNVLFMSMLRTLIDRLAREFSMKDLSDLHFFLGIEVIRNEKRIFLSQTKYALDLLTRANMVDCKPISTPFLVGSHLTESGTAHSDATQFRSLAGALQYLTLTRPDLSYSIGPDALLPSALQQAILFTSVEVSSRGVRKSKLLLLTEVLKPNTVL